PYPPLILLSFPTRRSSDLLSVDTLGVSRFGFISKSNPASTHPIVPFLSARTLVKPSRQSAAVPIILRVRPAQFTIIVVAGFCFKDRKSTRLNSSHVAISYA